MTSTPTPAQRVALEAIRDGEIGRHYPTRLGYRKSADPCWVRVDRGPLSTRQGTFDRLVYSGWARVDRTGLTDAGREALACRS